MIRIAHVVTHPIQYFAPLYCEINKIPDVELTVLFGSEYGSRPSFDSGLSRVIQFDVPLLDGFQYEFLPNQGDGLPGNSPASFDCPDLQSIVDSTRFDIVWIHGWGYRFQKQAGAAANANGLPYLIRGESTLLESPRFSLRWLNRYVKHRRFLHQAAACLYVGQRNRSFYRSMGVPDSRLFPAHYSVDTSHFEQQSLSVAARVAVRGQHGATENTIVVATVAKLIPRKRVADIVRAVSSAPKNVHLWVLGDGELSVQLKELARQMAPGRVTWFGFVNQRAIPGILSAADLFVLASNEETWGLVVNEAMACGLPAIVSDCVGCGSDLVQSGKTGFVYSCGNVRQLADRLEKLTENPELLGQMSLASRQHVTEGYSVQATARQIAAAARGTISGGLRNT